MTERKKGETIITMDKACNKEDITKEIRTTNKTDQENQTIQVISLQSEGTCHGDLKAMQIQQSAPMQILKGRQYLSSQPQMQCRVQPAVRSIRRHGRHLYLGANECFLTNISGKTREVRDVRPADVPEDPLNRNQYFNGIENFQHNDQVRWHFICLTNNRKQQFKQDKDLSMRLDIEFEYKGPTPTSIEEAQKITVPKFSMLLGQNGHLDKPVAFEVEPQFVPYTFQSVSTTKSTDDDTVDDADESDTDEDEDKDLTTNILKGRWAASLQLNNIVRGRYVLCFQPHQSSTQKVLKNFRLRYICARQRARLFVIRERFRPQAARTNFICEQLGSKGAQSVICSIRKPVGGSCFTGLSTPFGYIGLSLDHNGKPSTQVFGQPNQKPNNLTISLWDEKGLNPQKYPHRLSHIVSVHHPSAKFATFTHEGSGAKLKELDNLWTKSNVTKSNVTKSNVIKTTTETTLEATTDECHSDTYIFCYQIHDEPDRLFMDGRQYGYSVSIYDEFNKNWKPIAYCRHFRKQELKTGLPLKTFVEVVGPPDRERSGDIVRTVEMNLWAQDAISKQWYFVNQVEQPSTIGQITNVCRHLDGETSTGHVFKISTGGFSHYPSIRKPTLLSLPLYNLNVDLTDEQEVQNGDSTDEKEEDYLSHEARYKF